MCKPAAAPHRKMSILPSSLSIIAPPSFLTGLVQGPYSKRKIVLLIFLTFMLLGTITFTSLYTFHRGFRRTVQFWKGMAPLVLKYKYIKFKATKIDHCSPEELEQRLNVYRETSAPKLVDLILQLGGIYIKIGQVMSTIGQGLLPQQYVDALKPLQNGVPPRGYDEISHIIEKSTGKKMNDLFVDFQEKPIGAASVAQVHKATLRPKNGEQPMSVVIKVQYPEVAELFDADLSNLEVATKLFAPENMEVTKALRKRHENELDFRKEAQNLRECTRDMQQYGVEPTLVRIPRVVDEICTQHVLAMEYLEGVSLSEAIQDEQDRLAKALGRKDGDELKSMLASKMREHFENGGGAGSGGMRMLGDKQMKLMNVLGPAATAALRTYASMRDGMENTAIALLKFGSKLRGGLGQTRNEVGLIEDSAPKKKKVNVNLGRVLKTLVHVHGIQMILSGTYNCDPHPGNIMILPDGRLGLLDYGMVGRLSSKDRMNVAETIVALSDKDKAATAKLYRENGYKATYENGDADDAMLHRFASFHFDGIDLSPLILDNGEKMDIKDVFRSVRERTVPSWVEEGRRLGGLLVGVSAQAARPISLAKAWRPIAKQALRNKD